MSLLLSGCVLALLIWGFIHLEWYTVLVAVLVGIIGSVILARIVHFAWFLYAGGFVTVGATIYLLLGASSSSVILQLDKGGKRLVYDCNNFRPQVETPEDIGILVNAAGQTLSAAAQDGSMVTISEISEAMQSSDWRRLERAVVMYRGTHKK